MCIRDSKSVFKEQTAFQNSIKRTGQPKLPIRLLTPYSCLVRLDRFYIVLTSDLFGLASGSFGLASGLFGLLFCCSVSVVTALKGVG